MSHYNHNLFRAVSDYDLPHYFSAHEVWELPFHELWAGGPTRLTRGWNFYPIVTYRAGLPINIRSGISRTATKPGPSGAGDPNIVQANLVGVLTTYDPHQMPMAGNGRTGNFYFDPTAFVAPVTGYGTLGRDAFRGPGRTDLDLSISKLTNLYRERMKFEIIGNFFNALNHAEFNNPQTSITNSTARFPRPRILVSYRWPEGSPFDNGVDAGERVGEGPRRRTEWTFGDMGVARPAAAPESMMLNQWRSLRDLSPRAHRPRCSRWSSRTAAWLR